MKILFLGDVFGKLGRETIKKLLTKAKKDLKPDLIIANAENVAHGSAISEATLDELLASGIDFITMGDHSFDRPEQAKLCYKENLPIIRPANYPDTLPGQGYKTIKTKFGTVLIINLLGRVNMQFQYDCPFKKFDEIIAKNNLAKIKPSVIIVDIHAETTAEKICFGHFADGRVSAVFGTHTHVQTSDARILPKGTAYLTDAGMVGARNGSIGLDVDLSIKSLIDQVKYTRIIPEKGEVIMSGVLTTINPKTGKALKIELVNYTSEIK